MCEVVLEVSAQVLAGEVLAEVVAEVLVGRQLIACQGPPALLTSQQGHACTELGAESDTQCVHAEQRRVSSYALPGKGGGSGGSGGSGGVWSAGKGPRSQGACSVLRQGKGPF